MTETPFSDIPCNNIASKNKGEINFEQVFLPSSEEEEKIEKIIIKITKDNSIYKFLGMSCFVLLVFSLYTMVLIPRIVLMIVLIYIIIIALSLLFIYLFSENKLALSRNDKTRKLLVEKINHFGCKKNILNVNYNDFHIEHSIFLKLGVFLFNDFNNIMDYDIDLSDITIKPVKLFYNIGIAGVQEGEDLKKIYENSNKNNKIFLLQKNKLLKHSVNFFTFFIKDPTKNNLLFFNCIIIEFFFINILIGILILYFIFSKTSIVIILILSLIFIIFFIIITITWIIKKRQILRLDFIFSEGKNKLFIGLVKCDENSYYKTFLYDIENLQKFAVRKLKGENNGYVLKFFSINGVEEEIYDFHQITTEELTELLSLLNQKTIIK